MPSYLDHATDGRGDRRTYRRVSLIAGLIWGVSSLALVKLVIWGTVEVARSSDPQGLLEAVAASDHAPWPWLGFLAALIGFVPLAVVLPAMIERFHHRSWRTSVTPFLTIQFRQILRGAGIFGALYLLVIAATIAVLRDDVTVQFDIGQFIPGLVVLVALVWVQAFGQELLFRGYNMQWAWLDTKSHQVLAAISGLAFGVPFLFAPWIVQWVVPEVQVPDAPLLERALLMVGYVVLGTALALASLRTGTIELAIGAAFSFNVLTAVVLAPRSGNLAGGSAFELQSGVGATAVHMALLTGACVVFARFSHRLIPSASGRPRFRDALATDVLALPAGNPIWRVSVRSLLQHKLRLALTLVTVALSVAFITATMVFADTTQRALDQFFATEPADVVVRPVDPITAFGSAGRPPALTITATLAREIASVPGVEAISPSVNQEGVLILDPVDGQPVGGATTAHIGASWEAAQLPDGADVMVTELPQGIGEVAIDSTTADRLGVTPGDTIRLVTPRDPDPRRPWTVTGIIDIGLPGGATVAVFDLTTAQQLITGPGRVNQLLVQTAPGSDPAVVAAGINDELGNQAPALAITGRQAADQQAAQVGDGITFLTTLLTVFGIIALVTGVFLIINTFAMVVSQRRRELALLRAVGAEPRQLQAGIIVQASLLGLGGAILGVACGVYLAVGLRWGLRLIDIDVPGGGLVVSPRTLLIAAAVGIGATVVAAWFPAARAGTTAPVEAIRSGARASRESVQRRLVVAAILLALALITAVVGLRDTMPQNAVAWVGLSAVLGLAGFVAIAPWAAAPVLRLIALPLRGATGRIAVANNQRNPHRVTSTTAALSLGVALIAMISVLTSSASATADKEISRAFGSDLSIGAPPLYRPFDHSITERAAAVPGVSEATFIRTTNGQRRDIPIAVFGVQPDRITAAVNLTAISGDLASVGGDRIALDSRLAARYGIGVGDEFAADFRTGPAAFEVVAVFEPVVVFQGVLTDLTTAERLGAPTGLDTAAYFLIADGADPAAVRAGITTAIAANPALQVQDTETLKRNFADSINQLLGLVFAMLALAVIIAVLSIANTLLLSVNERTAEIGTLRAVGATRSQVRLIVVVEAAILGIYGAMCGLALGGLYGVLLRAVMAPLGITEQSLPWPWLALFLGCGAAAGVIASVWPAVTASRTNVLTAIATE